MTGLHMVPERYSPVQDARPATLATLPLGGVFSAVGTMAGAAYAASSDLRPTGDARADLGRPGKESQKS